MFYCIGINIDGTNITGGIVTDTGEVLTHKCCAIPVKQGGIQILQRSITLAAELIEQSDTRIEGIGIGSTGQIDCENGSVYSDSKVLPGWTGLQITEAFSQQLGLEAAVDNDVNVLAIGEAVFGAATQFRTTGTVLFVFLHAGVGGALLSNGTIHHGANWTGGEFGHIYLTMDPYARRAIGGSRGTLEAYCSISGLLQTWKELAGKKDAEITIKEIHSDAISDPEGFGALAITKTGEYLGYGLASLLCMIKTDAIVIGGELSSLGELLLNPARRIMQQRNLPRAKTCSLSTAKLGSHAAVIGAASLVMLKLGMLDESPAAINR